jgi:glycosyltransferase involved in cell wall biosynthesis
MPQKIIVDCERMKYPHTGLYNYCVNLGTALQQAINPLSEELTFFLPKKEVDFFGVNQAYMIQNSWQKLMMPSLKKYSLWHSTHQDSDYYPSKQLPIILTIHDINIMHNEDKSMEQKNQFIKKLQKKITSASHVTFISKFTRDDVFRHVDFTNTPFSVIYNGCNIQEIKQPKSPLTKPVAPFYFTIGTIMAKKNFHVLPALLAGNNNKLIIAGITHSEGYKQKITDAAIKLGVEDRLVFAGAISENDKQWYLKNCEAFLFPSLTEGFGLPVVEAMYFGVPVFLSQYTSLPEIGGDVCYYFSSFEKEAMQLTVEKGLQHHKISNAGERIKARASMFSWSEAAKNYVDVYRSLY